MTSLFPEPLRWYERLMIFMLSRSPRIHRILVEQTIRDDRALPEIVEDLEYLYNAPSARGINPY